MGIGTFLFAAFLFGGLFGGLATKVFTAIRRLGATCLVITSPRMNADIKWVKLKGKAPMMNVAGKKAMPTFQGKLSYDYKGRTLYTMDAATGEPYKWGGEGVEWPTAYDRASNYLDDREENINTAASDSGQNWAKIGAIMGGMAVLLLVITLGSLFRFFKGG